MVCRLDETKSSSDKEVYKVEPMGTDEYLILPEHCFDKEQRAIITKELPEEIQGLSAENFHTRLLRDCRRK